MSWTFTGDATSDRDKVRVLIGDTNDADQLVSDEVIAMHLAMRNNDVYQAAAAAARSIAADFGRQARTSLGPLSVEMSSQAAHFNELAQELAIMTPNTVFSPTNVVADGLLSHKRRRFTTGQDDMPGNTSFIGAAYTGDLRGDEVVEDERY